MRYALIENGKVVTVDNLDPDQATGAHVEAPEEVTGGWSWDGKAFAPPPEPRRFMEIDEQGRVVNFVIATPDFAAEAGLTDPVEGADIGDLILADGTVEKPRPPVPEIVEMRQLRLALLDRSELETVDRHLRQTGGAAAIEWEYATAVRRDHPMWVEAGKALGVDFDAVFREAANL